MHRGLMTAAIVALPACFLGGNSVGPKPSEAQVSGVTDGDFTELVRLEDRRTIGGW